MRIIWIELYVVLLFSCLRLKRREGIKKKKKLFYQFLHEK